MEFPSGKKDSQLVKELSKGNWVAFNTLFSEYSSRLYRFAYGYLKSKEEAEELVQEVFTKIWEKRTDLKEELSFKSYLFTIAFNLIRKYFRRKTKLVGYLSNDVFSDFDLHTSENIDFVSLQTHLMKLTDKLPPRRREIFRKSRFEGLSTKEIAAEMNITTKTVENQLTEALKFIRANLKKENFYGLLFFILFVSHVFLLLF